MKCSVCGKEFGEGMTCQNCGVDRVTGLGNYSGYETPNGNATSRSSSGSQNGSYRQEVVSQPKIVEVKSIVCYNCGEIIPADSKYCPHCSTSLYVTCPKCRHEYSSQYPACSKCGTNRNDYIEKQKELAEAERKRKQKLEINVSRIKEKQQQKEQTPEGREELRREKDVLDSYREKWSKERIEREKRMREAAEKAERIE